MIIFGWNCRGLGNPRSVRALRDFLQRWNPKIVFLAETKLNRRGMKKFLKSFFQFNCIYYPSEGQSGGLAMLWTKDTNLDIKTYGPNHIDAIITEADSGFMWRITGFYGHPDTAQRKASWKLLEELGSRFHLPWLCLGDFNEILSNSEKQGGAIRSQQQMDGFRNAINNCNLRDLGFNGSNFTWCNMREGPDRIYMRLDRALATTDWSAQFPEARVHHLIDSTSDHCGLLISDTIMVRPHRKRRFHFEALWTRRDECKEIIKRVWEGCTDTSIPRGLSEGLNQCAAELSNWHQAEFGHIPKKIEKKRKTLSALVLQDTSGCMGPQINILRREINELLDSEETYWNQRSRVQWLNEGDRNSKFFHNKASERKRKNTILGLWNDQRVWCDTSETIADTAISYFKDIFTSTQPSPPTIAEVTSFIPTKVTDEMNMDLIREFTGDEVISALKQMHPTKAPGPDEAFSSLIHNAARSKELHGISICRGCPFITHLFFADDSLLFCNASSQECHTLTEILKKYEAASGQMINTDKSSIFFSHNTPQEVKDGILEILGPMQGTCHSKYLGLPSIIGKSKNEVFAEIKERVGKKLSGWKEKMLSIGGKEVLIKAVAQAVPTYSMSCFLLPKGLCDDLEGMMRNFWWGQKQQEAKIAWVAWKKMCKSKFEGGMGFRNLHAFNLAMLAKQAWRILNNPNSIISRIYKAKYFPSSDLLNSKLGCNPSFAWRSIHGSIEVIKKGTRWRVGNGKLIHIWEDRWMPTPSTYKVISPLPHNFDDFPMVSALIDPDTKRWNVDLVRRTFLPFEASTILNMPLSFSLPDDKMIWIGNKKGVFTVKSAYYIALSIAEPSLDGECSSGNSCSPLWRKMWHLNIPAKVRIFAWRCCMNALPTMQNLRIRGVNTDGYCPVCDQCLEGTSHALFCCDIPQSVWGYWENCPIDIVNSSWDFSSLALQLLSKGSTRDLESFLITAWLIWLNRNQIVHDSYSSLPHQIWGSAIRLAADYKGAISSTITPKSQASSWTPPPPGYYKINVDGASSEDGRPSSIGVIIHDSNGRVMAAMCKLLQACHPIEAVEAIAIENGILLAQEIQVSKIIIESDALNIVQAINSKQLGGEFGHILHGILLSLDHFCCWKLQHLKRDCNRDAHNLAAFARSSGTSQVWIGMPPPLLQHLRYYNPP
ncbi:uncharacterized protein LOC136065014 [Quercus suber]|uniref:uncharacterized protein LOC136065014 n=1 Tax=Quercus suber TaxID=58331 RepID=UPI0032E03631